MAITITTAGSYALKSLDLGEAECNPIHTLACEAADVDPSDEEVCVTEILGWRDCPELDELEERTDGAVQLYLVHESGDQRGEVVWLVPA